jgi:hypothetical protein
MSDSLVETNIVGKICRKCEQSFPFTAFYRNAGLPDGYNYICKSCEKLRLKDVKKRKEADKLELLQLKGQPKPNEAADIIHQIETGDFQVDQKWLLTELITLYKAPQTKDRLKALEMIARISGYNENNADEKAIVNSLMESMKNEKPADD